VEHGYPVFGPIDHPFGIDLRQVLSGLKQAHLVRQSGFVGAGRLRACIMPGKQLQMDVMKQIRSVFLLATLQFFAHQRVHGDDTKLAFRHKAARSQPRPVHERSPTHELVG
jgi:hypothetical protein